MSTPYDLKDVSSGSLIGADDINALIRQARSQTTPTKGLAGVDFTVDQSQEEDKESPIDAWNLAGKVAIAQGLFAHQLSSKTNTNFFSWPRIEIDERMGLIYFHTESPLRDQEWANLVFLDPTRPYFLQYNDADGTPKVGHPIGPNGAGKLSVNYCGFVVLSKPDTTNKLVWVTRANDHAFFGEATANLDAGSRGTLKVIDDTDTAVPDPGTDIATPVDWNVIYFNNTGATIESGTKFTIVPSVTHGYIPISGFVTQPPTPPQGQTSSLVLIKARGCHYPGDSTALNFELWSWTGTAWAYSLEDITVYDQNQSAMLLPGEFAWALKNKIDRYDIVGQYGLFREAEAVSDISENTVGNATIVEHSLDCLGQISNCTISVCNGAAGPPVRQQTRKINAGERFWTAYFDNRWVAIYSPLETALVEYDITQQTCKPVGASNTFNLFAFNSTTGTWSDTTILVTVNDPENKVYMIPGERHFAVRHRGEYHFVSEFGLNRRGKAAADIAPGSEGNVAVWYYENDTPPTCEGTDSTCVVTACNGFPNDGVSTHIKTGDTVYLRYYEYKWHILPIGRNTMVRGTLAADLCSGTVGINSPILLPSGKSLANIAAIDVTNPRKHKGKVGFNVLAMKDENGKWEIIDVELQDGCVMVDIENQTGGVVYWRHHIAAEACLAEEPTTKIDLFGWYDCDGTRLDQPDLNLTFDWDAGC